MVFFYYGAVILRLLWHACIANNSKGKYNGDSINILCEKIISSFWIGIFQRKIKLIYNIAVNL